MSEPLADVYDLALRALDEQERRVAQLHARITPVLAAGGVGITLLTGPAFVGERPSGIAETVAVVVGVAGVVVAVLASAYLLVGTRLSFAPDVLVASAVAQRNAGTDSDGYFLAMTVAIDEQRLENAHRIEALQRAFTVIVCSMLVGVCGLAVAAVIG